MDRKNSQALRLELLAAGEFMCEHDSPCVKVALYMDDDDERSVYCGEHWAELKGL